jgi:hypothetical protein
VTLCIRSKYISVHSTLQQVRRTVDVATLLRACDNLVMVQNMTAVMELEHGSITVFHLAHIGSNGTILLSSGLGNDRDGHDVRFQNPRAASASQQLLHEPSKSFPTLCKAQDARSKLDFGSSLCALIPTRPC